MYTADMFNLLLLAVTPVLSGAQQIQQPLKDHQPELIIPLQLNNERIYTFETALEGIERLSSKSIADVESYHRINSHPQSALISIPLDAAQPGRMVLGTVESSNIRVQQEIEWIETMTPGEQIPITHVGIRKGAMVSKDAYSTRLTLETPYIFLPSEIFDILVQATKPTPRQHGDAYDDVVDCSARDRYPDLVLGLDLETEEQDNGQESEDREIVITPKQYVLETEEGQCILLTQRAHQRGREEVVLGWAAVRGRDFVLDWANQRTGFGR